MLVTTSMRNEDMVKKNNRLDSGPFCIQHQRTNTQEEGMRNQLKVKDPNCESPRLDRSATYSPLLALWLSNLLGVSAQL